jgi:uncharacterized membrane protein YoaK (UPF0700 family)
MGAARLAAAGLAFVGGFVDAYGYLRFGAFGANMTGNTVILAISLYLDAGRAFMPAMLIVLFFAGSLMGRTIVDRFSASAALYVEGALLVAAAFAPSNAGLGIIGFAMGMQNASLGTFAGVQANTSFVSGDYSRLAQAVADLTLRRSDEARRAISILSPLIVAYAGGALAGVLSERFALRVFFVIPIVLAVAYASSRFAVADP